MTPIPASRMGATTAPGPRHRAPRSVVLVVMCIGYFLVLLDVTIVNVALPQIDHQLGAGVAGLQWVVDGYALALAALLLASGTLGDVRGHRRVVVSGLLVFGVASLGCALTRTACQLVGARVVQGVGAALLLPGTLATIGNVYPERAAQARAIGIWAAVGSAALPAGPLLGGALVQLAGWRAVFLLNVPIVLVAAAAVLHIVPESDRAQNKRVDWAGAMSSGIALGAVAFAAIQAGHRRTDPVIAVALLVSAVLFAGFLHVERTCPDPMLPLGLFARPAFSVANAVAATMNLGTLGLLFLLPQYLQTLQHRSALAAGAALLPLFLPLTALAPVAGRLTARTGAKLIMAAGLAISAVGVALLARLQPDSHFLTLLPALLLWGIGLGVLTPAVVAAAMGAVDGKQRGLASGVNNTARQAGGAIGIAIYGAVAGPAANQHTFISGLHITGLATAALFLTAAVVTLAVIPAHPADSEPSRQ
jgi:DHA2 family methylenomycin A resistance protein-like MFS transporter